MGEVHADLGFQHLGEHALLLLGAAARKQMTTYDQLEPFRVLLAA